MLEQIVYLVSSAALGALHALEPGHGKTLVAAYIIGNRGGVLDALKLGTIVTVTHTGGVVLLGIMAIIFTAGLAGEETETSLKLASALLILALGLSMLARALRHDHHQHSHHVPGHGEHLHQHGDHGQQHEHEHERTAAGGNQPGRAGSARPATGQGPGRSRAAFREILMLGISGGIVPCHGALAVLFAALAEGGAAKIGWALSLVASFSCGLAFVVTTLALIASRFRDLFNSMGEETPLIKFAPLMSSLIILALGAAMTWQSALPFLAPTGNGTHRLPPAVLPAGAAGAAASPASFSLASFDHG